MPAHIIKTSKKMRLLTNGQKIPVVPIETRITILRDQKIILDSALAEIYGVPVKRLNQQVKRNRSRFPADFMFQLKPGEFAALRLQIATSKKGRGGRRFLPYAYTEHGAIMAATVLNSDRAVEMSVFVVRVRAAAGDPGQQPGTCGEDRRIRETSKDPRWHHPGNHHGDQETDESDTQTAE